MSNPACPACATKTAVARLGDVTGFSCPHCGGHCIRALQLAKFFERNAKPRRFAELVAVARTRSESPRNLSCPDCGAGRYRAVSNGLVEIDVCAGCGGAYFDRGEAALFLRQSRAPSRGVALMETAPGVTEGLGALAEFLSNLRH